jgi:hypothetical protein
MTGVRSSDLVSPVITSGLPVLWMESGTRPMGGFTGSFYKDH